MKETIENLIKDSEKELGTAMMENLNTQANDSSLIIYWTTRIQTLQQVLTILETDEEDISSHFKDGDAIH